MAAIRTPETILETLTARAGDEDFPSRDECATLLDLINHPLESVRESALALLASPPVPDEPAYLGRLLRRLADRLLRTSDLDTGQSTAHRHSLFPALAEFLRELLSFLRELPSEPSLRALFTGALGHLAMCSRLSSHTLPLHVAMGCLGTNFPAPRGRDREESAAIKRRYRLFRKYLPARRGFKSLLERGREGIQTPASSRRLPTAGNGGDAEWAECTTADIEPLFRRTPSTRCGRFHRGRWLAVLRPLLLPPARTAPCTEPHRIARSLCGGFSPAEKSYFEALTAAQAKELRSIRDLALDACRTTRRVVLSWHNAGLAAAGGWAFDPPDAFFPSTALFHEFRTAMLRRVKEIEADCARDPSEIEHLRELRERRLFVPKLIHALWESRLRAAMDPGRIDEWHSDRNVAAAYLGPEVLSGIEKGEKYARHGAVSPHQRISVRELVARHEEDSSRFGKGLALLAAMAGEAQKFLDDGRLEVFVLPWIDKFFISSRRDADREYLPALVRWIEARTDRPLVLFWEDTARAQAPSFQIALRHLTEQGHPYRGIGIFGDGATDREDALNIIAREHHSTSLFALRPCAGNHPSRSFAELLRTLDREFFQAYNSAWKDNLCFLYAGTRVAPLLSVQCEPEPWRGWTADDGGRLPFGTAFRSALRRQLYDSPGIPDDPLSLKYALRANLC